MVGAKVMLPGDAVTSNDAEVTPLPSLRPRPTPKPRPVLPLTGTFTLKMDDKGNLVLPPGVLSQLGRCTTVLVSPGSDRCLWLTNQAHLDRLSAKLDRSPAREADVRSFKRLYYAQTVKVTLVEDKAHISGRLATFAGLSEEVVLVGIDDHFEVWDAARWKKYTVAKKAAPEKE
jgi:MraZ protein